MLKLQHLYTWNNTNLRCQQVNFLSESFIRTICLNDSLRLKNRSVLMNESLNHPLDSFKNIQKQNTDVCISEISHSFQWCWYIQKKTALLVIKHSITKKRVFSTSFCLLVMLYLEHPFKLTSVGHIWSDGIE